jgi:hypothetical protein
MKTPSFSIILVALLSAKAVNAGVRIESVTRNVQSGQEQSQQVMQVQDGKARIEGGRDSVTIFKNDTLYILDGQRKTYMMMDRAAIERTANSMNQAMEQMRAQMASMPPEQRAMMEQMMKQNGMGAALGAPATKAPVLDAKATGSNGSYQGKSCKLWDTTRDGALSQQLCVVPFNTLQGASELRELSAKMQSFLNSLTGPMRQMLGNSPMQQSPELAKKLNGFPVITRTYRDGVLTPEETVVKSWQSQKIDAALFEIPAGYTKQEMPTMPGGR